MVVTPYEPCFQGGGANILYFLVEKFIKQGYDPLILATYRLTKSLTEIEIKYGTKIIYGDFIIDNPSELKKISKNFEITLANSVLGHFAVPNCNNVVWFIQEGHNVKNDFMNYLPDLKEHLTSAKKIFTVSDYANECTYEYNKSSEAINLGINDLDNIKPIKMTDNKIHIMISGCLSECKGQDVLVDAISKLDKKYTDNIKIHFCIIGKKGRRWRKIKKILSPIKNVYCEEKWKTNEKDKFDMFNNMDMFVVPSRDESCSLVTLEACMLGRPVIVTENVGAKYMVKNGQNGYVVKTGDSESLKEALIKIIDNKDNLVEMGKFSRKMYEEFANADVLSNNLDRIVKYVENIEKIGVANDSVHY